MSLGSLRTLSARGLRRGRRRTCGPPPPTAWLPRCPATLLQIVKFADAIPENYRAYTYALLSMGGGLALGLGIYGWSVWAG